MQESAEIREFVRDWFTAVSRGDRSLVDTRVSLSAATSLIGSDPAELFRGGPQVSDFLAGEVEGAGGEAHFEPDDVIAHEAGELGWATANLTISLPDGGSVSPRWTGVLRKEDGDWRFVHIHASFGVPNDDVGWVYPNEPR